MVRIPAWSNVLLCSLLQRLKHLVMDMAFLSTDWTNFYLFITLFVGSGLFLVAYIVFTVVFRFLRPLKLADPLNCQPVVRKQFVRRQSVCLLEKSLN